MGSKSSRLRNNHNQNQGTPSSTTSRSTVNSAFTLNGLYSECSWDSKAIKALIVNKRLAPLHRGSEQEIRITKVGFDCSFYFIIFHCEISKKKKKKKKTLLSFVVALAYYCHQIQRRVPNLFSGMFCIIVVCRSICLATLLSRVLFLLCEFCCNLGFFQFFFFFSFFSSCSLVRVF